jgi:dihydrolipoamide dehydrogenase
MADTTTEYDLIVIGGGPAGYAGAIRAGQLGKKVACIEMERAGGTCLNWGCIPTKALLKSAELYVKMKKADAYGLSVKEVSFDFAQVMERSRDVAKQMAKGIEFLFRKNKVDYIIGKAHVPAPGMVEIQEGEKKGTFLKAKNILIATGCKMRRIPGLDYDGVRVMTSREALANRTQPKSIVIVGAGAIGVEFAYFFNSLGTKVTLVEMLPAVLPVEDEEVSKALHRSFEKQGIKIHVNTKCENFRVSKDSVKLDLVEGDKKTELEADVLLSAIGVVANIDGVLGRGAQVELDRTYVKVNNRYETSRPRSRASTPRATSSGRPGSRTSPLSRRSTPSMASSATASQSASAASLAAPIASRRSPPPASLRRRPRRRNSISRSASSPSPRPARRSPRPTATAS